MFTRIPSPAVPYAHGGEITDRALQAAIDAAAATSAGTATPAEMSLFVMVAGPAMQELQQRRAKMDLIADLTNGNVLLFPGARG